MPAGQVDAEPDGEGVEGAERQRQARSPGRGRSAGCRARRPSPQNRIAPLITQPSGSISSDVERRTTPTSSSTVLPVDAVVRSTSSPSSACRGRRARRRRRSSTAMTSEQDADDERARLRARPGRRWSVVWPQVQAASTSTTTPSTREERAHAVLGAGPRARARPSASRGRLGRRAAVWSRSCQPELASGSSATALVLLGEEGAELVAGQEGVGPAVSSPARPSTPWCRASSSARRSTSALSASEIPGGATMPRQLVNTRSMPDSLSVGASMASIALRRR